MKRLIISIICSAVLVFGYFYSLSLIYQIFHVSFDTLATLLLPINLPYDIYKSIFGLYYGDPYKVKVLNFVADVIIYAIPFYLALTIFDKMKKKSKVESTHSPPEPPVFE